MTKVLIVDDAYFMRNLIKKALREGGYEVIGEAKNGTEGLQLYRELKPDLVTMDIKMPDISGVEVTRQIMKEDPNAQIIVITGNNNDDIKQEIMQAGAKDYLRKPFQPAFLLKKVEKIFQVQEEEVQEVLLEDTASSIVESNNESIKENDDSEVVVTSSHEDVEDDLFENMDMEIELQNQPDKSKEAVFVIENQEDIFEFPEEYRIEEKEKEHSLTKDSLLELVEEEEIELASSNDFLDDVPSEKTPNQPSVVSPSNTHSQSISKRPISFDEEISLDTEISLDSQEDVQRRNEISKPRKEEVSSTPASFAKDKDSITEETPLSIPSFADEEEEFVISPIQIRPPKGQGIQKEDYYEDDDHEDDDEDFVIVHSSQSTNLPQPQPTKKKGFFDMIKSLFNKS